MLFIVFHSIYNFQCRGLYKGHALAIDGEFSKNTVRSIKQFQKDKGLKVTGKVDEKTAKKLGII